MTKITEQDVKGAKMVLKTSANPKEIAKAMEVLKQYKQQATKERQI